MTSTVTAWVAYPVLVFTLFVVVWRRCILNGTRTSRRATAALTWVLLSCLLRERAVQDYLFSVTSGLIDVQLTRQTSTVALMLAMVPLLVLGASWVFGERAEPYRPLLYVSAALCALLMLVVGANARKSPSYIDLTQGWSTFAYFLLFSLWTAAMSVLFLTVAVRELRGGGLSRTVTIMLVLLGALSVWGIEESVSIVVSGALASAGFAPAFVRIRVELNENNLVYMALFGAMYASVPPAYRVLERLRIDKWSRSCRVLAPMWSDLTDACPEVRLNPVVLAMSPRQRAHRMTIEMRDSLSVLGRFNIEPGQTGGAEKQVAQTIAAAAARKRSGVPPSRFRSIAVGTADHLADEVDVLARLASFWPAVLDRCEASQTI